MLLLSLITEKDIFKMGLKSDLEGGGAALIQSFTSKDTQDELGGKK